MLKLSNLKRIGDEENQINLAREGVRRSKNDVKNRFKGKFEDLPLVRRDTFGDNIVTTRLDTFLLNEKRRKREN